MDKMKGVVKGGWHPAGDRSISRDTWKSDLKGIATGKKKDPYAAARDHQSAPLTSLKDPASFAPPPKNRNYHGDASTPTSPVSSPSTQNTASRAPVPQGPQGGWGSTVPAPARTTTQELAEVDKPKPPPVPYRADTSGLRTDHLPKPPIRRLDPNAPAIQDTRAPIPVRRNTPLTSQAPPPALPPRQNEYPDEYTPAPPPPYTSAPAQATTENGVLNANSINRLSRAGISVPGLGVGTQQSQSGSNGLPSEPQINELQQRFARMNAGTASLPVVPPSAASSFAAQAIKKAPAPLPPPKKLGLGNLPGSIPSSSTNGPPPLPMSSKPRLM